MRVRAMPYESAELICADVTGAATHDRRSRRACHARALYLMTRYECSARDISPRVRGQRLRGVTILPSKRKYARAASAP